MRRKFSSRKFGVAVAGFVTVLLTAFGVDSITGEQVISVITAASIPAMYIVGEGLADCVRAKKTTTTSHILIS